MADEFPTTSTLNVMFKGLSEGEKTTIYDSLSDIENVTGVSYEAESEKYNKDDYTLYTLTMGYDAYSSEAKTVIDTVKSQYSSYDIILSGESIAFVVLLVGSYFLQGSVNITYTMIDNNEVKKIFPPSNSIVVLYENQDESKIAALADKWGENPAVDSVNAYSTTLGKEMTYTELSDAVGMDETLVGLMYNYYFSEKGDVQEKKIVFGDFIAFLKNDVAANEQFASFFTEDALAQLDAFGSEVRVSSEEFAAYSGMDASIVQQIFGYYFNLNGQTEDGKIGMTDLTQFLMTDIASNPQFAPMFTEDVMAQLTAMSEAGNIMEQEMTSAESVPPRINPSISVRMSCGMYLPGRNSFVLVFVQNRINANLRLLFTVMSMV